MAKFLVLGACGAMAMMAAYQSTPSQSQTSHNRRLLQTPEPECSCTGNLGAPAAWNAANELQYNIEYGNYCGEKWDAVTPTCMAGGASEGQEWCQEEWCYVPSHCPGATATAYFDDYAPAGELFYSYAQCDAIDTFTASVAETHRSWAADIADTNCVMNEHGWRLAAFGEMLGRGCIRPATIMQHFRNWLAPPSPSPPPGQVQVDVVSSVVTFSSLDMSYMEDSVWHLSFVAQFQAQMAASANVLPADVEVTQIMAGSLAVSSLTRISAERSYEPFLKMLHDHPGHIFNMDSFKSYGNVDSRDISVVTMPMLISPPPPSPPPPFPPGDAPLPPPGECECTGNFGAPAAWNMKNDLNYHLMYGASCGVKWDAVTPTCMVGGDSFGADWCQEEWCYVPGHCPGATPTAYFEGYVPDNVLFYSYDQCDGTDSFSGSPPPSPSPPPSSPSPPPEVSSPPPPLPTSAPTTANSTAAPSASLSPPFPSPP